MCRRRWIAVGARNNLLLEGAQRMVYTTPSWYTSTTSCFFSPGSFLRLQVSHCCCRSLTAAPPRRNPRWRNPTRKIQKGKSFHDFWINIFFQPWLPKFNVNYNKLKEAGNSICFLKTTWSIFQKAWWLCLAKKKNTCGCLLWNVIDQFVHKRALAMRPYRMLTVHNLWQQHMAVHTGVWLVCCFTWQEKNWLWCLQCSGVSKFLQMQRGQRTNSIENPPAVPFICQWNCVFTEPTCCFFVLSWKWTSYNGVRLFGWNRHRNMFLTGKEVEQFQWIDNSAARQLVWRCLMHWNVNRIFACAMVKQRRLQDSKFDADSFANYPGWFLLKQKHHGEIGKQDVFACHWNGRHSETARPSEQRRQAPCGRSNLQNKIDADFFSGEMNFQRQVLKWRYEDWKIPNGESMIKAHRFKEECVEFSLLNMRQHGMTSTHRDECIKFSHTSARPLLVKKKFAARFAVRVHFFRVVEIGFIIYLHLVNFFSGCFRTYLLRVGSSFCNLV